MDSVMEGRQSRKVFCVGFPKTGTTSLASALRRLGFRAVHGDGSDTAHGGDEGRSLIAMIERGDFNLPTLEIYDAFTDNPYFTIWRPLAERFPDARFILTLRNENEWISSCIRYYRGRRIRPMRAWTFGDAADPSSSAKAAGRWLSRYRDHNAAVQAHFALEPGRLLILDLFAGDGWNRLCPFLELPIPNQRFPHANRNRQSSWLRRLLRPLER